MLARNFYAGIMKEKDLCIDDKTQVFANVDSSRTLRSSGDCKVQYAYVISGGEELTMMLISLRWWDTRIEVH